MDINLEKSENPAIRYAPPPARNVMIVDDEKAVLSYLDDMLTISGYHIVAKTVSGMESLKLAEEYAPDIILMDIVLPGEIDGIEACDLIQKKFEIPVVLISAYSDAEYVERALQTQPYGYVLKPFGREQVKIAIELALEKKRKELALEHIFRRHDRADTNNALFLSIFENAPFGAFVLDSGGAILYVNRQFSGITGYNREEIPDMGAFIVRTCANSDLRRQIEKIAADSYAFLEFPMTCKAGDIKYVELRCTDLLSGFRLGALADVSNYKRTESELVEAKIQADKANQAKSEFLANMSHEIRTPISGIMGLIDMTMTYGIDPSTRHNLTRMKSTVKYLSNLVNDILDLSRIEVKKLKITPEHFDLYDTLVTIKKLFEIQTRNKGLYLKLRIYPEVPRFVYGDPFRLEQILNNIISNAIKFTETGGIVIEVKHNAEAGIPMEIEFSIHDTGVGISTEKISDIFKMFTQLNGSLAKKYPGAGLGLAISKGLIEMMGGKIGVHSEPGKGSVFTFTVLFESSWIGLEKPVKIQQKVSEIEPVASSLNILVAEDDALSRRTIEYFLRQSGYRAKGVNSGKKVLEILMQETFDLILMDIQMPEMDGLETTRRIREDASGRFDVRIPILAITAYAMDGDKERILSAGIDDYISKPIEMDRLGGVIDQVYRRNMARRKASRNIADPFSDCFVADIDKYVDNIRSNDTFAVQLLKDFVVELEQRVHTIHKAIEQNDTAAVAKAGHNVVSITGAIRIQTIAYYGRQIEKAARNADLDAAKAYLEDLEKESRKITRYVRQLPVLSDR